MNLNKIINIVFEQANLVKTTATKPIADAVKNREKISFMYYGPTKPKKNSVKPGKRIKVEPVAIGLSKKGNLILRGWVEPPSVSKKGFDKTNWRTFILGRMRNVEFTGETFDQKRPGYKEGSDNSMTVTYVTSDWTKKPKVSKPTKPTVEPKPVVKKPEPAKKIEPEKVEPEKIEPQKTELPQPKPEEKPTEKPSTEIQPQDTPDVNLSDKQKELYNKKRDEWIAQQKQTGGNIKPGQGTRERFKKEVEKELPEPKPQEKPKENPENGIDNLQEEIQRIKKLIIF